MTANPLLGIGISMLGGVAAALYLLPFRAVRGWAYETGWLVAVLVGWLLFPLAFTFCVVPDFFAIITSSGLGTFVHTVGFGAPWGIGALCWALMVRYLGVGLGLAIGAGLCAAAGTLLPPVVTGRAASLVSTPQALRALTGVLLSLVGIAFVGMAGRLKEGEMSEEAKRKAVAEYDFRRGLVLAVIAGLASAGINFGLQGAPEWESTALAQGTHPLWAGQPVLTVTLWGGVLTQVAWVMGKSKCWRSGKTEGLRSTTPPLRLSAVTLNLLLSCLVGIVGVSQFFLQKVGEPLLGNLRYLSFAVLMASAIFFSTLVGTWLGEWRGAGFRTKCCLGAGLAVLTVAFYLMGS